jgi:hypothetical protein
VREAEDIEAVEFALNEQDFLACSNFVFWRNLNRWRFGLIRRIILGLFAVYAALALLQRWSTGASLVSFDDFAMVVAVLIILLLPYIPRFFARRRFRSAEFAKIRVPRRVEISAAGLRTIDGIGNSLTLWPSILDIAVTPDAAYLFILRNSTHILPRRAFADETAFNRFVEVARACWRSGASPVAT